MDDLTYLLEKVDGFTRTYIQNKDANPPRAESARLWAVDYTDQLLEHLRAGKPKDGDK